MLHFTDKTLDVYQSGRQRLTNRLVRFLRSGHTSIEIQQQWFLGNSPRLSNEIIFFRAQWRMSGGFLVKFLAAIPLELKDENWWRASPQFRAICLNPRWGGGGVMGIIVSVGEVGVMGIIVSCSGYTKPLRILEGNCFPLIVSCSGCTKLLKILEGNCFP